MRDTDTPHLGGRLFARLWIFVGMAVIVLEAARVALWFGYAGSARLPGWSDLFPALLRGGHYDFSAAATWALGIGLLTLPFCLWKAGRRMWAPRVATVLCILILALFALLSVAEFYYYGFYHSRFDPVIFGLFQDDTGAIISAWHDYPIARWLLAIVVGTVLACYLYRACAGWLERHLDSRKRWLRWLLTVVQILLLALLARGSLGTFPLMGQDVVFSPDPFENALVLNAPVTLYEAIHDHQERVVIDDDPLVGLHDLGFSSPQQAAAVAGLPGGSDEQIKQELFAKAPGKATGKRPNVVLALLESFGYDMLHADGPNNDMLGRLRKHFKHDYVFTNFITGQNGTHAELENLLLGSPITPLTQGPAGRIQLATSAALPFKRAGYRTVFIYAGGRDWRDIGKVFKHQGFDEIYDARNIKARYPEAGSTAWGVYDKYLFAFARHILDQAEAKGQPIFLFLLTTTNHPPYTLDTPHRTLPLDPKALGKRGNPDMELRRKIMLTYQYQADQFGAFLDGIEASPLGKDTIVAAAGDHNLRDHYDYSLPSEQPDVDRVVGFFRLPQSMRPAKVDTARFCGHEDIIPTLVSLALPGSRYFDTGVNLFAPPRADDHGLALFERTYWPQGVAFGLRDPKWHAWTKPYTRIATEATPIPLAMKAKVRRVAAGVALRDWYIRTLVLDARKSH